MFSIFSKKNFKIEIKQINFIYISIFSNHKQRIKGIVHSKQYESISENASVSSPFSLLFPLLFFSTTCTNQIRFQKLTQISLPNTQQLITETKAQIKQESKPHNWNKKKNSPETPRSYPKRAPPEAATMQEKMKYPVILCSYRWALLAASVSSNAPPAIAPLLSSSSPNKSKKNKKI